MDCPQQSVGCSSLGRTLITPEIQRIAEEQLGEIEERRISGLQTLKQLLTSETKINPRLDDEFLLKFLRARKFNCKAAFKMVKNYYAHRSNYSEVYKNYTPKDHIHVMEANLLNYLPLRSSEGYAVFVSRFGLWDPSACTFEELLKFGLMCNEKAIENPVTQICGTAAIVDMNGLSLSQILHCSPYLLRCFVSALQDCLPMRIKAVHVLNAPTIFSIIFSLIKPLIKAKLLDRIYFHDDLSKLQQYFPEDMLPEELGGTAGAFQNKDFYQSLIETDKKS